MGEQSQRAWWKVESASTVRFIAVHIAVSVFTCSNEQVPFCLMGPTGSPQTPSVPGSWPQREAWQESQGKKSEGIPTLRNTRFSLPRPSDIPERPSRHSDACTGVMPSPEVCRPS